MREAARTGTRLVLSPRAVLTPLARDRGRLEIEIVLMLRATVTGSVWATRRIEKSPAERSSRSRSSGGRLVAFDVLGSGVGEHVLVATGSVASGWFGDEHPPIDALIIGSIDEPASDRRSGKGR